MNHLSEPEGGLEERRCSNMIKKQIIGGILLMSVLLISQGLAEETKGLKYPGEERRIGSKDIQQIEEYRISPGNVLQIEVFYGKLEKLSVKVKVSPRGLITFPLLEEVKVEGLTVSGAKEKLTYLLKKDFFVNPQVFIFIEEYSQVFITGEVKNEGSYPLKENLTVIELISLAGGFTEIAAPNRVKIIRILPDGSKEEIRVRVHDTIHRGRKEGHILLKPGDIVVVPESIF
jgi:polysaccharide export outer membrane protein